MEENVPVKGKKLPSTATDMFNYLLLGIGLVFIGGVLYYVRKRRKIEE